jgi:PAS domain S-box-containing protein
VKRHETDENIGIERPVERDGSTDALRADVAYLRDSIDAIPGLIWSARPDGYIDYVSERWVAYTGFSLAQVEGWRWTSVEMVHADDRDLLIATWKHLLAKAQGGSVQARFRRSDGEFRWHVFHVMPMRDELGNLLKWWGLNVDVDQSRRAEHFLAHAQRLSQTGCFSVHLDTRKVDWSEEVFRIYGFDPATMAPSFEAARARVHPDDVHIFDTYAQRIFRDPGPFSFDLRILSLDGETKHLTNRGLTIRNELGVPIEIFGALMDVTDRVRAAEALRASERLARGQLDALTSVLDALVRESNPDRFLEHVMMTIVRELGADSIQAWLALDGSLDFECISDYQSPGAAPGRTVTRGRISRGEHAEWGRLFHGAKAFLIGVLDTDPPRARVAGTLGTEVPWRDLDATAPALARTLSRLASHGVEAILCVPMQIAGKVIGCLNVHFAMRRDLGAEELELAIALAHQAALAIQLTRLSHESRQAAVIAERNRLARDIHDTLAQGLTGVIVQLEAADDATARNWKREALTHVQLARELARESLNEARRSVSALRPGALEKQGLVDALRLLTERMTAGMSIQATVSVKGTAIALPPAYEEHLLRIGQEALTNTLRHARAKHVDLALTFLTDAVRFRIRDDGRGFRVARDDGGLGLRGIRERVQSMEGRLVLRSKPTAGTVISVLVSLKAALAGNGKKNETRTSKRATETRREDSRPARGRSQRRARRPVRDH